VKPLNRNLGALPTIVVLTVVLGAGARLIYLSAQHHAAVARVAAAGVAASYVKKIAPALQTLSALADRQAETGSTWVLHGGAPASLKSVAPEANTFWMSADDQVLGARSDEAVTASGIASEWKSAESGRPAPLTAALGPMRLGSEWIVAIRVPVGVEGGAAAPGAGSPAPAPAPAHAQSWAVAYADFEELIADAHLARLIDAGYDFEVSQLEPRSASARIFVSSSNEPLADTIAARITLPVPGAVPGSYLQLAIRPRAGWFPSSLLASDIALLVFLSWLLAFGTYDMGHALERARSTLAALRHRVHTINQQLAVEMSQRLSLQQTFDHARFHDTFTGLPNRRYFMDRLDRALREVRTKRRPRVAVIVVDISRFKLINHLLGHTAGDDLMVQVARRFEAITSNLDGTLARWGGDQFAFLLLDVASPEAALEMANLLQEQLRSPFHLRRHQLSVAATLGVTCADSGQERAEDIMREADIALSDAKRQDTTKAVLYTPNMGGQAADLVSLDADLHVALQKHQLRLLFQPIVDLGTRKMVGAEALLRWRHPVEGLLTPDRFLRNAEEAGLMIPITRWVIERVIDVAAEWRRVLAPDQKFYLSINLSPAALRDPDLDEYLAALLRERNLPATLLKFELTELALVGNVAGARESLERLHDMGIQLILDDFGTGYSSLSNLQLFPFDSVKIDCPFVDRRGVFQANMSMVAAMIQLAGSLDLTPIAEIVEGEAAAAALKAMGCRYGQGYYFSEPIEAEAALRRLGSQNSFEPAAATSDTLVVSPIEADGAHTLMMRRAQAPDGREPAAAASDTLVVSPIEADGAHTLIMRRVQDPSGREPATADTVIVRPLEPGGAREIIFSSSREPARREPAPAPEETSSTVMLPMETAGLMRDDDDDDEEEEDEE
jgi:diguanylate cyclase (GGDEF)-like protein